MFLCTHLRIGSHGLARCQSLRVRSYCNITSYFSEVTVDLQLVIFINTCSLLRARATILKVVRLNLCDHCQTYT